MPSSRGPCEPSDLAQPHLCHLLHRSRAGLQTLGDPVVAVSRARQLLEAGLAGFTLRSGR